MDGKLARTWSGVSGKPTSMPKKKSHPHLHLCQEEWVDSCYQMSSLWTKRYSLAYLLDMFVMYPFLWGQLHEKVKSYIQYVADREKSHFVFLTPVCDWGHLVKSIVFGKTNIVFFPGWFIKKDLNEWIHDIWNIIWNITHRHRQRHRHTHSRGARNGRPTHNCCFGLFFLDKNCIYLDAELGSFRKIRFNSSAHYWDRDCPEVSQKR